MTHSGAPPVIPYGVTNYTISEIFDADADLEILLDTSWSPETVRGVLDTIDDEVRHGWSRWQDELVLPPPTPPAIDVIAETDLRHDFSGFISAESPYPSFPEKLFTSIQPQPDGSDDPPVPVSYRWRGSFSPQSAEPLLVEITRTTGQRIAVSFSPRESGRTHQI